MLLEEKLDCLHQLLESNKQEQTEFLRHRKLLTEASLQPREALTGKQETLDGKLCDKLGKALRILLVKTS